MHAWLQYGAFLHALQRFAATAVQPIRVHDDIVTAADALKDARDDVVLTTAAPIN